MKLATEFHDGMSFPADTLFRVCGEADMPVTVSIDLQSGIYLPADGTFEVEIAPHKAGGPYTMFIECGGEITKLHNIYFK